MKPLGLKRYTVQLLPHQDAWADVFNTTKSELEELIGKHTFAIQHIGSTSIKGIPAKPIIDIAIAIEESSSINNIIPILENNNFEYRGNSGREGGHLFVRSSEPEIRTHHVHIVKEDDEEWRNYLFFRDELNRKPNLAKLYAELKVDLAAKHPTDRGAYTSAKNEFIRTVLAGKNAHQSNTSDDPVG